MEGIEKPAIDVFGRLIVSEMHFGKTNESGVTDFWQFNLTRQFGNKS